MKRALLLLTGYLLQLTAPYAYAEPLYDTVKKNIEEELQSKDVEETVAKFIAAIAKENEWGITEKEVKDVIEGDTGVCSKHETLNGLGCFPILDEIKTAVAYENEIRLAGRRLQSIATSYELPVSEIPGRASTVSGDLSGVVNLWKAGTGALTQNIGSGGTIPSVAIEDKETMQSLLQNLAGALEGLEEEERVAAVWKYQYGERLIKGERAPEFPAPVIDAEKCETSERRFLCKRWDEIESALDAIWTELRLQYGTNPDQPVFYLTFPDDLAQELPDGIVVWARMDKDSKHPAGDVGLQWKYAFQPVLPALMDPDDKPILGGNYPPAPKEDETVSRTPGSPAPDDKKEGSGLCSMSFALRGYLCRPVTPTSASGCPKPEDADKDAITLVGCTSDEKGKTTNIGPDVCADISWQTVEKGKAPTKTVCTPETLTQYKNTIGNNLCFIGECVEQSLETHRVTGGRTPAGVQDEAYPNDDPLAGSPLGNFLAAPTAGQPILPPYKPLQPVREFEAALCALVGLPVSSPPALCVIAANRRTDSPLGDPLSTILSMAQLQSQQRLTSADAAMLAESVGMRMGTDLYARNLRVMSKTLSEVIGVATKLLNEVKSIEFPTEMCPLGAPSAAQ